MAHISDQDFFAALQARVISTTSGSTDASTIKTAFWKEVRTALAVNKASVGLDLLDALAEAVIEGDTAAKLGGLVVVLPDPGDQEVSRQASPHERFQASSATPKSITASKASSPASKSTSAPTIQRAGKKRASSSATSEAHKPKRSKTASNSSNSSPGRLPVALSNTLIDPDAPKRVLDDLAALYREARRQGVKPFRLAYPWEGNNLWYDPAVYSSVHVAHFRFWMLHRKSFWEWAINAPLRSEAAYAARRKNKMNAMRARLAFLSICIETWGYYRLLKLFERRGAHHSVLWMGGQPGKQTAQSKSVKGKQGPVVEDLAVLYRKDTEHYERVIGGALDPDRIDADGYSSIPSLLELTKAIGPDIRPACNRLSDRALARIRRDITSNDKAQAHWAPKPVTGLWKELVDSDRIQELQDQIEMDLADKTYKFPTVPDYDHRLDQDEDNSDFETEEGFAALPPEELGEDDSSSSPSEHEDLNEAEKEDPEEQQSTPKSPDFPTPKKSDASKSTKSSVPPATTK